MSVRVSTIFQHNIFFISVMMLLLFQGIFKKQLIVNCKYNLYIKCFCLFGKVVNYLANSCYAIYEDINRGIQQDCL